MYEITWEHGGITRTFTGVVKQTEIIMALEESYADPRFLTIRYSINDFSSCNALIANLEQLSKISREASEWRRSHNSRSGKLAFVSDDVTISVELQAYVKDVDKSIAVRFFTTIEAAREWVAET